MAVRGSFMRAFGIAGASGVCLNSGLWAVAPEEQRKQAASSAGTLWRRSMVTAPFGTGMLAPRDQEVRPLLAFVDRGGELARGERALDQVGPELVREGRDGLVEGRPQRVGVLPFRPVLVARGLAEGEDGQVVAGLFTADRLVVEDPQVRP